jgi:hypothetical protein
MSTLSSNGHRTVTMHREIHDGLVTMGSPAEGACV